MLLFKLAVGKVVTVYNTENKKDLGFPENADTIYFSSRQEEVSLYNHQYRVKNPRQYALEYDVSFKFVEKPKFDPSREQCEYCKQNTA